MSVKITSGFSPGDDEKVISILKKFKGGPVSDKLFEVLAGILPTTPVIVVFITNKKDPEILFVPRPSDDPVWPSALNLPGNMIRLVDFKRSDNSPINGAFERIQKSEIHSKFPQKPKFIGINLNTDSRGPWIALVYKIELTNKSDYLGIGEWVKVDDVEKRKDLINSEINHINVALGKVSYTD
jgi:hypothetical protein